MKKFLTVIAIFVAVMILVPMNGAMAQETTTEVQATFFVETEIEQGTVQGRVLIRLMYNGPKKLGVVRVVLDYDSEHLYYSGVRYAHPSRTVVTPGGVGSPDAGYRSTIKFMTMLPEGLIGERMGTLVFLPKDRLLMVRASALKVQELQLLDVEGNSISVDYEQWAEVRYAPPCLQPFEEAFYSNQEDVSLLAEAYACYKQAYASIQKLRLEGRA
jgi:hypothetical protein